MCTSLDTHATGTGFLSISEKEGRGPSWVKEQKGEREPEVLPTAKRGPWSGRKVKEEGKEFPTAKPTQPFPFWKLARVRQVWGNWILAADYCNGKGEKM